ncbi:MAG: flippase activity-associated protein Agl23 [Limisphaerales bacterium]
MANPPLKIRWTIFIALALAALAVRLPQLGARPMHTDESINAYITGQLLAGEKYHYDPRDRHGPVLYLLAKPVAQLCGAKDFSGLTEAELRLTPVIFGSITVLMFGAGVEMFGFIPCLIAALLFAVAPLPVYFSRYFIHETLFVAATLGLILSGGRVLKSHSILAAVLAGFCAALMLATKETAIIHFFALGVAGLVVWLWSARTRPRFGIGRHVARSESGGSSPHSISPGLIALTVGTFIFATVLLFTWFGQNSPALADLFRAIPHLAERAGGQGHEKPFVYYFSILDPQFLFSIVAAVGVYVVICDAVAGMRRAGLLLAVYGLLILLIYSAIPYKTPWLALNFWLPLALLCGLGVEGLWLQLQNAASRWIAAIAIAALMLVAGQQSKTLAFDRPADDRNPLAYAHTTEDILGLPARIEEVCRERKLAEPRIAVVAADAWPLPWYLRKCSQVGYWQPGQETGPADFFITSTDVSGKLAEQLKDFRPEFFGVRPNVLLILWTPPENQPKHE